MKKEKGIKAWSVLCSRTGIHRAYVDRDKAREHCKMLNNEYLKSECTHKVIPVLITPINTNKFKKKI